MRAAVRDARPVPPVGVNVFPPLSLWALSGGATYDPVLDEITLPSNTANAASPLIRIDGASSYNLTFNVFVPTSPASPTIFGQVSYWQSAGVSAVNSGGYTVTGYAAPTSVTDTWTTVSPSYRIVGPQVRFIRWLLQVNSPIYGVPGTRYREGILSVLR